LSLFLSMIDFFVILSLPKLRIFRPDF